MLMHFLSSLLTQGQGSNYHLSCCRFIMQRVSFSQAITGAIQSALYLDCNLSAPNFSMLSFYFPLSILGLIRMVWLEKGGPSLLQQMSSLLRRLSSESLPRQQSTTSLSAQDGLELQHQANNNDGNEDDLAMENNATNKSNDNQRHTRSIRAKPERRNHLLSRWSQYPPSPSMEVRAGHDQFYRDDMGDIEPNDTATSTNDKPYSLFGWLPLHLSLRTYALIALIDVYANYTTILAFKYTTITSVSLFDALAIPSAIFVSRVFFARRYTKVHLLAVLVCGIGVVLNVFIDNHDDNPNEETEQEQIVEEDYPRKGLGDFLAITGGLLFGIGNTLQEVTVRDTTLTEYMTCMALFASIISFLQAFIWERDEIKAFFTQSADIDTCSPHEGPVLFVAFMVAGCIQYIGIAAYLQISDAAFFNLSLLTGDAWAVAFSVFGEGIIPPPLFYVALSITVSGVFIYETAPSPVANTEQQEVSNSEEEQASDLNLHVLT